MDKVQQLKEQQKVLKKQLEENKAAISKARMNRFTDWLENYVQNGEQGIIEDIVGILNMPLRDCEKIYSYFEGIIHTPETTITVKHYIKIDSMDEEWPSHIWEVSMFFKKILCYNKFIEDTGYNEDEYEMVLDKLESIMKKVNKEEIEEEDDDVIERCGDCINFEEKENCKLDWCAWHVMEVDKDDNPKDQCCNNFESHY